MIAVTLSLITFMIAQSEQLQTSLEQRSEKTINTIVGKEANKIDKVETQLITIINAQGNISNQQRQTLLNEFLAIQSGGGLAVRNLQLSNTHILHEILGNLTEINNKTG